MKTTRTAPFAKLVVVIEDNPLVLEATTGLLRSWGCCVVAAKCCDEALVSLSETEADRSGCHRKASHRVRKNSSASHQCRCERSVRTRARLIPPFVQAAECREASCCAGRCIPRQCRPASGVSRRGDTSALAGGALALFAASPGFPRGRVGRSFSASLPPPPVFLFLRFTAGALAFFI
jgi:CheY-like chemotaxis protein